MKRPIRPVHGKDNNYTIVLDRMHTILNGGIDKGSLTAPGNMNNVHVFVTTPNPAGTEFTVTHNLGRVPQGFNVVQKSAFLDVIASRPNNWTTTQLFAKCDTASQPIILEIY